MPVIEEEGIQGVIGVELHIIGRCASGASLFSYFKEIKETFGKKLILPIDNP